MKRGCSADKNECLEKKGKEAKKAASKNYAKTLYIIIKDLTGKKNSLNVPIADKNKKRVSHS